MWPFMLAVFDHPDLYNQTQAWLLSPVFFVSGLQCVVQCLWLALQRIFRTFSLYVSLIL